ncbi:MAG: alpha/beta hydrolase, partial [Vicinamibacterales bacterium]
RANLQITLPGFSPGKFELDLLRPQMDFSVGDLRVSVVIRRAGETGNGGSRGGDDRNHAIVKVYYATDRARISYEPLDYGGDRSPTGRLQLGRFDVSVPRDHQLAKVERPTILTFWREDPNKHFIIVRRIAQTYDQYYREIASLVGQSQRKEVFVFVHGFNVTFESAIYRTAQMAYDLGFDGAPIVYSWPSEGSMVRYPVDLNNNDWTWPNLRWFLEDIAAKTGAQKVHLIAHSMGNRALVNALNRIVTEQRSTPRPRFSQVVLTAPDIDAAQFIQLAQSLRSGAERVTLYASSNDEALKLSKAYQGYQRAGDSSPDVVVVPGLDTIDVSAIDTNLIGHFYYGDNRSVLTDIFYLLRDARPPGERFGLRQVTQGPRQWWVFKP